MALWTVGYDVCLAIHFELWQGCTTVFAAVVPWRCAVFRSKLSAARCAAWVFRLPTVGAATAIGWWKCSGRFGRPCGEYLRKKAEIEGKTAVMVGVFVLPQREKNKMQLFALPHFVYLCSEY